MCFIYFLKRFYLFIFRERGKEGEKHQCVVASCTPPTGDLACNLGICPDWESNRRPFGLQASTQSTEPHQPGLFVLIEATSNVYFWCGLPPCFSDVKDYDVSRMSSKSWFWESHEPLSTAPTVYTNTLSIVVSCPTSLLKFYNLSAEQNFSFVIILHT